jgi:hypothetical protein
MNLEGKELSFCSDIEWVYSDYGSFQRVEYWDAVLQVDEIEYELPRERYSNPYSNKQECIDWLIKIKELLKWKDATGPQVWQMIGMIFLPRTIRKYLTDPREYS